MKSFQQISFLELIIFFIIFVGCGSGINKRDAVPWKAPEINKTILQGEIIDYKNKRQKIPEWVTIYLDGDIRPLENTEEYQDYYIFIAEQTSSNFSVLRQWEENFRIEHDFTQLVFYRIYNRMTQDLTVSPDDNYGIFFEMFMKSIAEAIWPDAALRDSFWIYEQNFNADEGVPQQDMYRLMIMCIINKKSMQKGINEIMDAIEINRKFYSRVQLAAINRIKSDFLDTF